MLKTKSTICSVASVARLGALAALLILGAFAYPWQSFAASGDLDPTFGTDGVVLTNLRDDAASATINAMIIQGDGRIVSAGSAAGYIALVRHEPSGSLDTDFGLNGKVLTPVTGEARAVVVQGDGRILAIGSTYGASNLEFAVLRFNADGSPDADFGDHGVVVTAIGSGNDLAYGVALQGDGKIVVAGRSDGTESGFAVARYNADGSLDASFGGVGKVITTIGTTSNWAYGVAIQADGKIIAAGIAAYDEYGFALVRYNTDGSLDATFGVGGVVISPLFGGGNQGARALTIQGDGKLVAVGGSQAGNQQDFAVARYNADGSLDMSFGGGGVVITTIGSRPDEAYAVAIALDGKILVAGMSTTGSQSADFAIVRYNVDGSPDTDFDGDGIATISVGSSDSRAYALDIQTDGKVVSAGTSFGPPFGQLALARFTTDGSLDTGFGAAGTVTTGVGNSDDRAHAVAVQGDQKIVVVGAAADNTIEAHSHFAVVRYDADGSLDPAFGVDGKVIIPLDAKYDEATGVAIQGDGKIVAAGYKTNSGHDSDFAIVRLASDGVLDPSFGVGGITATDIAGPYDVPYSLLLQPDGKIVVGGTAVAPGGGDRDFAIARYNGDGSLDTTFGTGGKVITHLSGGDDFIYSLALDSQSRVIAAGYAANGANTAFALARYMSDGSLDASFGVGGSLLTTIGISWDQAFAVVTQPGDKIVVAGYSANAIDGGDFALVRYDVDGGLDSTFGTGGKVETDFAGGQDAAFAVLARSDGKIIVGGYASDGVRYGFGLARYNVDGSLDASFGINGKVITTLAKGAYGYALAGADGGIIAAGVATTTNEGDFAVVRYLDETPTITPTPPQTPTATLAPTETPTTKPQKPDTLILSGARLRIDTSPDRDNGTVLARGIINDNDSGGGLVSDLLAGVASLNLQSPPAFSATIQLTGCAAKASGKVTCRSSDGRTRATFRPIEGPFLYKIKVTSKRLSDVETGSAQPSGPVTAVFSQSAADRPDVIANCRQVGSTRLVCREP